MSGGASAQPRRAPRQSADSLRQRARVSSRAGRVGRAARSGSQARLCGWARAGASGPAARAAASASGPGPLPEPGARGSSGTAAVAEAAAPPPCARVRAAMSRYTSIQYVTKAGKASGVIDLTAAQALADAGTLTDATLCASPRPPNARSLALSRSLLPAAALPAASPAVPAVLFES